MWKPQGINNPGGKSSLYMDLQTCFFIYFPLFFFRDWLNMLSPPIVPPGQQPAEQHQDSSGSLSAPGGNLKHANA